MKFVTVQSVRHSSHQCPCSKRISDAITDEFNDNLGVATIQSAMISVRLRIAKLLLRGKITAEIIAVRDRENLGLLIPNLADAGPLRNDQIERDRLARKLADPDNESSP